MTSQHLTDDDTEESTLFQEGSPANLIALQENVRRLVTSAISGERSSEYWAKQNPDGSWERTSQDSLALNLDDSLDEWSMTWPRWGTAWDGVAMEHPTLELAIEDDESLSLGTPTANDAKNSLTESQRGRGTLTAGLLPTPRANNAANSKNVFSNGGNLEPEPESLPESGNGDSTQDASNTSCGRLSGESRGRAGTLPQNGYRELPSRDWRTWSVKPVFRSGDDGVPDYMVRHRVNVLKALGNAVVPQQVYPILKAIAEASR